ncbi:PQQ-dependent sugar dehydrogenase [Cytophaga aurantiaca]|uniref:PQQ-dependent sugar dehydrogenase n=1 Tax=Cytophaga aurantiaca TaxID=29530 RepID=UPI00037B608D|nr:hypothetical protein [Cytophaga aurantiaca]
MNFYNGLWAFLCISLLITSCSDEKESSESKQTVIEHVTSEAQPSAAVETVIPLPEGDVAALQLIPHTIQHPNGDTFTLNIPRGFDIKAVAWGMKRIRFMAQSPDEKLFLTDMYNLEDNKKGKIYILSDFDDSSMTFKKRITYLENLHNPNSIAFYKDASGKDWLYIALTDQLIRYAYEEGDEKPSSEPEVLDTYPDYGLSYRYGGWHLTRTIQFGSNNKLYVSVGSSCNSCIEKEEVRAAVVEMDPDGKNRKIFVKGLRNAVGLEWAEGNLFATNMAADHLGTDMPDDAMFRLLENKHYGWPYCYHSNNKVYDDPKYDTSKIKISAKNVPGAFSYFGAHTAPLGLSWFGKERASDPALMNYFLVAQHGSYNPAIGRGYCLQRVRENTAPEDFITGFRDENNKIHGRPCGIFPLGEDAFYFTDDKFGTLYFVYKK